MGIFTKKTPYDELVATFNNFSKHCSDIMIDIMCINNVPFENIDRYNSDLFFYVYNQSSFTQNFMILFGNKKANRFADYYVAKLQSDLSKGLTVNDYDDLIKFMGIIEDCIFKAVYDNKVVTKLDNPSSRLSHVYFTTCVSKYSLSPTLLRELIEEFEHQHRMMNDICYNTQL